MASKPKTAEPGVETLTHNASTRGSILTGDSMSARSWEDSDRSSGAASRAHVPALASAGVPVADEAAQQRGLVGSLEPAANPNHRNDSRDSATMRTTVTLNAALLEEAQRLTGLTQRQELLQEGLKALIARESARRLARLGGSEPQLELLERRRMENR